MRTTKVQKWISLKLSGGYQSIEIHNGREIVVEDTPEAVRKATKKLQAELLEQCQDDLDYAAENEEVVRELIVPNLMEDVKNARRRRTRKSK